MHKTIAASLALALAAPLAAQAPASERLASPALPGFVVGYSAANAAQSIREEVPRGETAQAWTRMVTTQRFTGLARRATPASYAQNVLAGLPQGCPGARVSPVSNTAVAGCTASRFQVDCPRNAVGQPESFILLAIAGRSDMHVKQVAWRGRVGAVSLAWGRAFLDATLLCLGGDRTPACRR